MSGGKKKRGTDLSEMVQERKKRSEKLDRKRRTGGQAERKQQNDDRQMERKRQRETLEGAKSKRCGKTLE